MSGQQCRAVFKHPSQIYFVRVLGDDGKGFSDRIILPFRDNCRVKVTKFRPKTGFTATGIVYPYDETIAVLSGSAWLRYNAATYQVNPGRICYVPAGMAYDLEVREDSQMVCVFSPVGQIRFASPDRDQARLSRRILLAGSDPCRVRAERGQVESGFMVRDLVGAMDVTVYVLSGSATVDVDGAVQEVGPGHVYHLPAGTTHGIHVREQMELCRFVTCPGDGPLPDDT